MNHWNYRIVKHTHIGKDYTEDYFETVEMFYDNKGRPSGYAPGKVGGLTTKEIEWTLKSMKEALKRPVIDAKTMKEI